LTVAVAIELFQGICGAGDFLCRDFAVAIGIERFHERVWKRTPTATFPWATRATRATGPTALLRTTVRRARRAAFVSGGLSGHDGQSEHCGNSRGQHPAFHFHCCTFLKS